MHSNQVPCVLLSTLAAQLVKSKHFQTGRVLCVHCASSQQHRLDPVHPCATNCPISDSQWATAASLQSPDTYAPWAGRGRGRRSGANPTQFPEPPGWSPALDLPLSHCSHVNLEHIFDCQHRCELHLVKHFLCSVRYQNGSCTGAPVGVTLLDCP